MPLAARLVRATHDHAFVPHPRLWSPGSHADGGWGLAGLRQAYASGHRDQMASAVQLRLMISNSNLINGWATAGHLLAVTASEAVLAGLEPEAVRQAALRSR
jgi:hypothetical protein